MLRFFKRLDWLLIFSAVLIILIGLTSLYSSSSRTGSFTNFWKQVGFFILGLFFMFFFSSFQWRIFRENNYLIFILYLCSLLSLAGLFLFAPEIRGVRKWYKIGLFSIDPIEFVKIILVILLAKYFSMKHIEMYRIKHILLSGFYVFLPAALTFFQPDFGSIIIFGSLWIGILIVSGIKLRHFLVLLIILILILSLAWVFLMEDYQKERILSFVLPIDPLGTDWSKNQAKIAIGSGGFWGQGLFRGSQTQYGFLPEVQTDFIFAALAEEAGLFGVSVLLLSFLVLFWRILIITLKSQSNFPRLFCLGIMIIFITQIFINIGMNLGLLPIIGISLPLVSYGGGGLITNLIALGIIQNIKNNP